MELGSAVVGFGPFDARVRGRVPGRFHYHGTICRFLVGTGCDKCQGRRSRGDYGELTVKNH